MGPEVTNSTAAVGAANCAACDGEGSAAATAPVGDAGELEHAVTGMSHKATAPSGKTFFMNNPFNYQPNQFHNFVQIQMPMRRNITTPAARHPVEIFARPCMPERSAASGFATDTRA